MTVGLLFGGCGPAEPQHTANARVRDGRKMELAAQTDQKKLAWWFIAGFVAVAAIAVAYRVPRLGERTFHGDEAVQAFKAGQELY